MVPEGWEATEIGSLAEFKSGGTPTKSNPDYWGGDLPWVSGKDLKQHYISSSIDGLTEEGFKIAKKAPQGSSLILVRGMTLLKDFPVGYAERPVSFNQDIKALVPRNGVDGLYLSFLLAGKKSQIQQLVSIAGHGTGRLDTESIKAFPTNLPPHPEQQKIAQILSTWDKAITTTEQLLANSQQQKKALMQQLLTGKKRLPGFSGEWTDHHLTDIAKVLVSPVDKKTVPDEIPVLLCNYTDVYYNSKITRNMPFMEATAKQSEIDRFTLKEGDVVITKDSETPGDIAVPTYVAEDLGGVVCGYHLAIVRPKSKLADGAFLNYLFSTPQTRYYFFTLATGATRFGLSIGGINKAHFRLPPIDEQRAISSVLSTQDSEIDLLQETIKGLKTEKQALMQQLLTGNKRVTLDKEVKHDNIRDVSGIS